MTPSISILLPARARPPHLRASVESCFALAEHPENVEVLIRLDDDDPHLSEELALLAAIRRQYEGVQVWTGPRLGYARLAEYFNELAKRSRGQWLVNWNDDMTWISAGYDRLLLDAPPFCVQMPRRDIAPTTDTTVPVIGRPWYETLGHLSLNAYCDAWIADVSAFAGTTVARDDIVFHHERIDDATMREQAGNGETEKLKTEEQRALRRKDMEAIMAAPGYAGRFYGWETETTYHQIDHINLMAGEARARQFVLKGRIA